MKTTIEINHAFKRLRPFFERIASSGVPAGAQLIYRARNSVYTTTVDGLTLNIKAFRKPSFPNNYIYTHIRQSKARRSYYNAQRLINLGIDTPSPVGYIENVENGQLTTSYYISLQLQGHGDMRRWLENPVAREALPALAKFLYTLHQKGVWHKDFSPGNVLFKRDKTTDSGFRFFLIDLNRMEFDMYARGRQLRNLASIYIESEEETARFARMYAQAAGLDAPQTEAEALRLYHKYLDHKRRLKRLKNMFK